MITSCHTIICFCDLTMFLPHNRFFLSGPEVLFAAEQQLEAAGGIGDTAFVTIKLTLDDKGQGVVEAFQVSIILVIFWCYYGSYSNNVGQ